jgi:restriction endonuclease S subunit
VETQTQSVQHISRQPRWDFRYFEPKYIDAIRAIKTGKYPAEPLSKYVDEIANFGAYSLCNLLEWVDEGIPYIRVTDLKEDGISWDTVPHIPRHVHEQLPKSKVYLGDVLYSMAGTIGLAVVAPEDLGDCNSNQAIAKIRLRSGELSPHFLAAFLNSRLGRYQSERIANGQIVLNINLGEIGELLVPVPPRHVQDRIASLMSEAFRKRNEERTNLRRLRSETEDYVLRELGLAFLPKTDNKHFLVSASALAGKRFDVAPWANVADLKIQIKTVPLHEIAEISHRALIASKTPSALFSYIGMTDVNALTGEVRIRSLLGSDINSNKVLIKGGDIVFARIEPCIYNRKTALIPDDVDEALCSTELYVARARSNMSREFLLAILRSEFVQRQIIGKMTGTTGRRRLPAATFANLQIPDVPLNKQLEIEGKVKELKEMAKRLEEKANRIVTETKIEVERIILGEHSLTT